MNTETITQKLVEQVCLTTGRWPEEMKTNRPVHELGVDSLGLVELFIFVENEFDVQLMHTEAAQDAGMTLESLASAIADLAANR